MFFDKTVEKNAIPGGNSSKMRKYHRDGAMSDSEEMTILILFHNSGYRCLKHFYLKNSLMAVSDKVLLRKRSIIESINDELKNMAQVEHSRHRSFHNFFSNLMAGIAAYCFFPQKPMLQLDREFDNQLTIC